VQGRRGRDREEGASGGGTGRKDEEETM